MKREWALQSSIADLVNQSRFQWVNKEMVNGRGQKANQWSNTNVINWETTQWKKVLLWSKSLPMWCPLGEMQKFSDPAKKLTDFFFSFSLSYFPSCQGEQIMNSGSKWGKTWNFVYTCNKFIVCPEQISYLLEYDRTYYLWFCNESKCIASVDFKSTNFFWYIWVPAGPESFKFSNQFWK